MIRKPYNLQYVVLPRRTVNKMTHMLKFRRETFIQHRSAETPKSLLLYGRVTECRKRVSVHSTPSRRNICTK